MEMVWTFVHSGDAVQVWRVFAYGRVEYQVRYGRSVWLYLDFDTAIRAAKATIGLTP